MSRAVRKARGANIMLKKRLGIVGILTACLILSSASNARAGYAPDRVPASSVPRAVKEALASQYSLVHEALVPKSYICGEGQRVEYGKIVGWFHGKNHLSDADSANGITSSDDYQVHVKIYRKGDQPWGPIEFDPAAETYPGSNGGAIFDVLYERTNRGPKLVPGLSTLC